MKYWVELGRGYIQFPLKSLLWRGIHKLFGIMKEAFRFPKAPVENHFAIGTPKTSLHLGSQASSVLHPEGTTSPI